MHKRFWIPKLDAAVLRRWSKQLRAAAVRMPKLAHALLQQHQAGMERFTDLYRQLRALPRTLRRQLQRQWACSLAGVALLLTVQPQALWAANFSASNESELRQAITDANNNAEADIITLERDISLTDTLPVVSSKITIAGAGHTIALEPGNYRRILEIDSLGDLTIQSTTISGGNVAEGTCGGIKNTAGTLALIDSTVSDNFGDYGCGGICNYAPGEASSASTTLTRSTVSGNDGGGICNYAGYLSTAVLTLTNSTVSGNYEDAGGIDNRATSGGSATVTLNNCTVSDNSGYVGGLYNHAEGSGGQQQQPSSAVLNLNRTIVSGNNGGKADDEVVNRDYGGATATVNANSLNLFGHSGITSGQAFDGFTPGASDIVATSDGTLPTALASILLALGSNGGPTQTHALTTGSPAVNGADTCGLATDQRSVARNDGDCDIGAYEGSMDPPSSEDPCDDQSIAERASEGCIVYVNGRRRPGLQRCIGTNGDDTIIAPKTDNNIIVGLGGNDLLRGQQGNDILCGGPGDDILIGALGDDTLSGGEGKDELRGKHGNDIIFGGSDDDLLVGWYGKDRLIGGPGNDYLLGGWDDDYIDGGVGDRDVINGGPDTDVCLEGEKLIACEPQP